MKHPKHDSIVQAKINKILEKKATKMLKVDEKMTQLKEKNIKGEFLKLI